MSSRLDLILSFVDELDARSDVLLSTVHSSNKIINDILSINDEIEQIDNSIDDVRDLMVDNALNLNEFSNLYEKSFYLESNLQMNDLVTNQMSFEQLANEFRHLMKKLEKNDDYSMSRMTSTEYENVYENVYEEKSPKRKVSTTSTEKYYTKNINVAPSSYIKPFRNPTIAVSKPLLPKAQISMSNLQLKPIKCSTTKKLYKKKSRYRLSGIYNINPIAYDEYNSPLRTPQTSRDAFLSSNNTSISSNIMHSGDEDDNETHSISTSPMQIRHRSNSLPETPSTNFADVFQSTGLEDMLEISEGIEHLRLKRLDHFISCVNLQRCDRANTTTDTEGLDDTDKTFDPNIDLNNHEEFDNLSILSDVSYYSPQKQKPIDDYTAQTTEDYTEKPLEYLEEDSYEHFLRSLRVDLNEFPLILKKSNSHDSIFNNSTVTQTSSYKFHNPIENVRMSTSKISTPTVEKVLYSKVKPSMGSRSSKLLHEVKLRSDKSIQPVDTLTPASPFSLFKLHLVSPKKSAASVSRQQSQPINITGDKPELFSRSLTDSFLSLIKPPSLIPNEVTLPQSSPPIAVTNDISVKRLPVRIPRNDGYHSRLTIGPNNTRIINHGESSVFNRPLVTRVSHNSLKEALSQSFN